MCGRPAQGSTSPMECQSRFVKLQRAGNGVAEKQACFQAGPPVVIAVISE
jgi:hypothetical protein